MTNNNIEEPSGPSMEEKILSAAEQLFFRHGFSRTSTTEIARQAGCNQALVHYYFRTKENLFHTVLGGKVKSVFRKFLSLETGEGSFEQKLTRLIETHYDILRENSNMVLFLVNELTNNPHMLESIVSGIGNMPRQALKLFQQELNAEMKAGRIREVSIRQLLFSIISLNVFAFAAKPIYANVWRMKDGELEAFYDERKKEIVTTILKSLRP